MAAACTESRSASWRFGLRGRASLLVGALATCAALAASPTAGATTTMPATVENVPYGSSSFQAVNIYPSPNPGSPVVEVIHGGGWRGSAWLGVDELQSKSLQAQGFTVYEVNYRHDTTTTLAFPMEPEDVLAATRFAISTASSYNGDPQKLVMIGGSAGGQLAAIVAGQINAETPDAVEGVTTLSAAGANFLTLRPMIEKSTMMSESFEYSVERALGWHAAVTPFPQAYAERWSPTLHPPSWSVCPRWQLFNSELEFIPLSQAEAMQQSLVNAGCVSTLTVVPGSEHGFGYFHVVKSQIFDFVRAVAAES
jgi:acetyl esterase/lipase